MLPDETAVAQPINDDFANAVVISGDGFTYSGSTLEATNQGASEPVAPDDQYDAGYYGLYTDRNVWFVYTASADGSVSFNTVGSDFDTTLVAYRSSDGSGSLSSLLQVAYNDDSGDTLDSAVSFSVTGGESYWIRVGGLGNDSGNYAFTQGSGAAGVDPSAIQGTSGDDVLGTLLDGAREMIGGDGDDTYYVGSVDDVVTELGGEGYDTVYTTVDYTLPDNVERILAFANTGLTLTGNALDNSLIGGAGGDTLYGLDGDDTLNGRGGVDTMVGGLGNDSYVVNKPSDVVVELAGEGVDTVYTTSGYRLSDNVENIVIRSDAGLSVKGNALDNAMTGGAGADTLAGYDGDDRLDGRGGADSMIGGAGDDSYFVDDAGDIVVESANEGYDTVYTTANHALAGNVEKIVVRGSTGLVVAGNDLDNAMTGGVGEDTLLGGAGADRIGGGAGADVLFGGAGKDVLTGGGGADIFIFAGVGDAGDTIADFEAGVDTIALDIEGFGLTRFDPSVFESNALGLATDADTRFIYSENNGRLFFDADGSGAEKAVLLATLRGAPALSFTDLFIFVLEA